MRNQKTGGGGTVSLSAGGRMTGRSVGGAGLTLIKEFEGCRLTAYKAVPTERYWTIGWGHYGPDVKEG